MIYGAVVIDADYRGAVGAILFNFSDEDFVVNQGDRIAQIIFEKIKTPEDKRVSLGDLGFDTSSSEKQVDMAALV